MTRRYTDEELSRILGEHKAGTLVWHGAVNWIDRCAVNWIDRAVRCCVNQAAFNLSNPYRASQAWREAARWFDSQYMSSWTTPEFLAALEAAGLA